MRQVNLQEATWNYIVKGLDIKYLQTDPWWSQMFKNKMKAITYVKQPMELDLDKAKSFF